MKLLNFLRKPEGFKYNTFYQHETSTDTVFVIDKLKYFGKAEVCFYNINIVKIGGNRPLMCGYGTIKLNHRKEYRVIDINKLKKEQS